MKKKVVFALAILLISGGISVLGLNYYLNMPTLIVSPEEGKITAGSFVTLKAFDEDGINHIAYLWDANESFTVVHSHIANIVVPAKCGKYTLYAYTEDAKGYKTLLKKYVFDIYPDTIPPTISAAPCTGTVKAGTKIFIISSDSSGIKEQEVYWDNNEIPLKNEKPNVTEAIAPSEKGTHILYVSAVDIYDNDTGTKRFIFNVE